MGPAGSDVTITTAGGLYLSRSLSAELIAECRWCMRIISISFIVRYLQVPKQRKRPREAAMGGRPPLTCFSEPP